MIGGEQPSRRVVAVSTLFYGGLSLLLIAIVTKALAVLLPAGFARSIGDDSEGYLLAIVLAAWIQFGRWRLRGARLWSAAIVLTILCAGAGVWMLLADPPKGIKTLNEACFALALLIPYVTLKRPLVAWAPPLLSIGIAVVVTLRVVVSPDSLVVNFAETTVALVIAPWAFDVFDRGILNPRAHTVLRTRLIGYGLLFLIPSVVVLLGTSRRTEGGFISGVLHYLGRSQESFVGILLVTLFLAVGLGATGNASRSRRKGLGEVAVRT